MSDEDEVRRYLEAHQNLPVGEINFPEEDNRDLFELGITD